VTANLNPLYADSEVDVRSLTVEQAEREISQCLISVAPGHTLEILVADSNIGEKLKEWATKSGHLILGTATDSECERIYLERQY
jgi:TusA-related sulfurtransferase